MRRKVIAVGVVAAICLGVVVTRAVWEGRSALSLGDEAQKAGDPQTAIRWWRRAARWYVPGAPHVGDAYDRLDEFAVAAEARGDSRNALAAWRGIRGSILATRSFYTPHVERLAPANRRIAALMAKAEGASADPARTEAERATWHYELLARDEAPSVFWSIVALLGFGMWIAGGGLFALRAVTKEDQLVAKTAAISGILVATGLVVWMLGLFSA